MAKTKTFERSIILIGIEKDFGLGPGVVVKDKVTYTDDRGCGFNNSLFQMSARDHNSEFLHRHVKVQTTEIKSIERCKTKKLITKVLPKPNRRKA